MAKNKQQKQKEREKRVAQKKLAETAKRREIAKKENAASSGVVGAPRAKKVLTAGVKNQTSQVQSNRPTVAFRRAGG